MKEFLKKYYLIIILITVAAFARFYKLADLYYFMMDEERDFFIASNILKGKLTLIGGSVPGGLFLGPLYFYFTSVLLFLFRLQPIGMAFVASLFGVMETILLFKTVKLFIKRQVVCFFTALFYAVSFLIVIYNRTYWPLTFAPLVTILTWNFLYRIMVQKNGKYIIPLGIVQLVGLQTDPSNISSFIVVVFGFILAKVWQKSRREAATAILIILLAHAPLLIFDLRHDFYIGRQAVNFFLMKKNPNVKNNIGMIGPIDMIGNTFSRVIFVKNNYDVSWQITISKERLQAREKNVVAILKILGIFCFAVFIYRAFKSKNAGLRIIAGQLLVIIFGMEVYAFFFPGYLHEWFLNVFWPGFAVIFIHVLYSFSRHKYYQIIVSAVFLLIVTVNLKNIFLADNSLGYRYKNEAVKYIKTMCFKKPCSIDGSLSWSGFEYLSRLQGFVSQTSAIDHAVNGWLYQKPLMPFAKTIMVVVSPDELLPARQTKMIKSYLHHEVTRKQFGGYLVLVVDNSSQWR